MMDAIAPMACASGCQNNDMPSDDRSGGGDFAEQRRINASA
jgi:hypothetical protein